MRDDAVSGFIVENSLSEGWYYFNDINDHGVAVGSFEKNDGKAGYFIWTEADGMKEIFLLGEDIPEFLKIDNSGNVVVCEYSALLPRFYFLRHGGEKTEWELPDSEGGHIMDMSDSGVVLIKTYVLRKMHLMVAKTCDGQITDLGELIEQRHVFLGGINDLEEIVGTFKVGRTSKGFIWSKKDGMKIIAEEGVTRDVVASKINNNGQVVGRMLRETGGRHVFIWSREGGIVSIDNLNGFVASINDNCQMAGFFTEFPGFMKSLENHAFLWTKELGVVDLDSLWSGVKSSIALDINNKGQIVGSVEFNAPWRIRAWNWLIQAVGLPKSCGPSQEALLPKRKAVIWKIKEP